MTAAYARPFGKTEPEFPAVGDTVRQNAYGMGLGRLEDCGRLGTVTAVNRTKVIVDFGAQLGTRPVHPNVLRLEDRV